MEGLHGAHRSWMDHQRTHCRVLPIGRFPEVHQTKGGGGGLCTHRVARRTLIHHWSHPADLYHSLFDAKGPSPGAVLLTGYLGGTVATNLRLQTPLFSNTLFPVYFGILAWVGLWLRERELDCGVPFREAGLQGV